MKLSRIKIEGLFGQFDYDIKLNQEEGITILTGPNGYGKTTILNIIYNLYKDDLKYFDKLIFSKITITLSSNQKLADGKDLMLTLNKNDKDAVINGIRFNALKSYTEFWSKAPVYFIKDQRLTYSTIVKSDGTFKYDGKIKHNGVAVLNRIDLFSNNLAELISQKKAEEDKFALSLADTFPERLLKFNQPLPQAVFEERFKKLSEKQQCLQKHGMNPGVFAKSEYEGENKRILSVYLEDYEQKTGLYDELLGKIELFLSILNGKKLVNKTVAVDAQKGFHFISSEGKSLPLTVLSSGEQNEIILIYGLLFNAPPNSLVLIDEPETSMHVAWQIEFLQDIENIAKLSRLSFIIATHSPDLINDKMDLCVDLAENAQRNGNDGK